MGQIIYLFTSPPLFSPFFCLPALLSKSEKEGNLAGKEKGDGARYSLILDGGRKTTEEILFLYAARTGATHSRHANTLQTGHCVSDLLRYCLLVTRHLREQVFAAAAGL